MLYASKNAFYNMGSMEKCARQTLFHIISRNIVNVGGLKNFSLCPLMYKEYFEAKKIPVSGTGY